MGIGIDRRRDSVILGVRANLIFGVMVVLEPVVLFGLRVNNLISDNVVMFAFAVGIFLIFIYAVVAYRLALKFRPILSPTKAQKYFRELGKSNKGLSWAELKDNVVIFIVVLAFGFNLLSTPLLFRELPYFGLGDGGEGGIVFGSLLLFFSLYAALISLWMRTASYTKFVGKHVRLFVLMYFIVALGIIFWQLNLITNFFNSLVEVIR